MTRHAVLIPFAAFQALDIATTWAFLAHGGSESNPIIAQAIHAWGPWGMVLMKAALTAPILGCYAWLIAHDRATLAWQAMIAACAGMLLVVSINITTGLILGLSPFVALTLLLAMGATTGIAGATWRAT